MKFKCLTWWEQLRTLSYSWVYDSTNILILALPIYHFHLMLQSVLFRVMETSIVGTPCDISFYWKDGALEKLCLRATKSLIGHWLLMGQNRYGLVWAVLISPPELPTMLEMMHILQAQGCGCISAHPGLPRQKTKRKLVMHQTWASKGLFPGRPLGDFPKFFHGGGQTWWNLFFPTQN